MPRVIRDDLPLTGIASIDMEHRHFIDLTDCLSGEVTKPRTDKVVAELLRYAEAHFASEERVMRAASYPEYEYHKSFHDAARDEVNLIIKGSATSPELAVAVSRFMRNWLLPHIQSTDMRLANWLRNHDKAAAVKR